MLLGIIFFILWLNSIPLCICTTSLSIHLLMDIEVSSLSWLLEAVLHLNTGVHIFFQTVVFSKYLPRRRIAGSYGSSSFSFLTSKLFFIVAVHSYQQCKKVPFSPHRVRYLLFVNPLMMAILTGCGGGEMGWDSYSHPPLKWKT